MKKTLKLSAISASILATSLLLTSSAFAHSYKGEANYKGEAPCPIPEKLQSGFYLGGQVGYDSYRARYNFSAGNFPAGPAYSTNPAVNATGFVGGLFVGYGQYFNDYYYLGGELLGNYSGASTSWNTNMVNGANSIVGNASLNAYGTWGLALLPGIKLNNDSLLYLRLGYDWTRVKANGSATVTVAGVPTFVSSSNSQWSSGFVYGLGLETLITGNWSLRTEFSHTNNNSNSSSATVGGIPISVKINPSDNQVMVGLLYHFA